MRRLVPATRSDAIVPRASDRTARLIRCGICAGLAPAAALGLGIGPVAALTPAYYPVTAGELIRNPGPYLHRRVELDAAYCYSNRPGYTCVGVGEPLEIRADRLQFGATKRAIDESCSGLDAIEHTPLPECRFVIRFVPTAASSEAGDYIRDKRSCAGR